MIRLIRRRVRRRAAPSVFLAADDRDAKARWTARLAGEGIAVLAHDARFDPEALRQTSGEDFVVDLFALARCGEIVGTTPSYVVRTADWMRGRRRSVFAAHRSLRVGSRMLLDALRARVGRP